MHRILSALLAAFVLGCAVAAAAEPGRILVWQDRLPCAPASDPAALLDLLARAGLPAEAVDSAGLAAPGRLDPKQVAVLVLPYGPHYPAPARAALLAYLRGGGAFLSLGGRALSAPLLPTDAGWVPAGALSRPTAGDALPLADFEEGGHLPQIAGNSDSPGMPRTAVESEGRGRVLQVSSPALKGWEYAVLRVPAGRADRPVLRFRARGDGSMDLLCIEPNEQDASRWKAVVPLTRKWQTHRVHAAEFRSYATPARAADTLHPERVTALGFGITGGMAGQGRHRFWLDDVAWEPGADVPSLADAAPLVATEGPAPVDLHFGHNLAGKAGGEMPLFPESAPLDPGARLAAVHPLMAASDAFAGGALRGWSATGRADDRRTAWEKDPSGRLSLPRRATGRRVTLLTARDARGREAGPAFSLMVHAQGEFAGGRWAYSGVEKPDLFPRGNAAAGDAFVGLVRALAEAPLLAGVEPQFVVEDGRAVLRITAPVVGARARGAEVQVRARVLAGAAVAGPSAHDLPRGRRLVAQGLSAGAGMQVLAEETTPATLAAGERRALALVSLPLDRIGTGAYRVEVELLSGGQVVDRAGFVVDPGAATRALAEEFLRRQQKDGTYGGIAFIDNRGARTLLALWALTGEERYRKSALRWGEVTLARQREDGGYRMGYGISAAGEECYVADGGEIAVGIARLAVDAPAADRPRYQRSLERYLRFREEFRCPEGGIGVGYCKSDYGARPVLPLKEIRRIYAPELNTYTIGCTLAAAAFHAVLPGTPEERARAAGDARWLMAHTGKSIGGPFVESYYWAHHLLADAALRTEIETHLRERFLGTVCGSASPWWLSSGGRSALNLGGLAYAAHTFAPEPAVHAELARGIHAVCGDEAPWSLTRLAAVRDWSQNDWIYACYAGISLVDVLRPGVALPGK